MTDAQIEILRDALAAEIREESRAGRLAARDGLLTKLEARGLLNAEEWETLEFEALVSKTMAVHEDLAVIKGIRGENLYHAPVLLSRTYASILARKGSPILLLAGEVRMNSSEYPRPLPLYLCAEPPFDLTNAQIKDTLKEMASNPEYADIACTTTSTGALYLFSSSYLEPAYAAYLAERAETGLLLNP